MTTTLELLNHPRISTGTEGDRHFIRYGVEGWGSDVVGEYWQEPRPADLPENASWDGWRYKLAQISGKGGTYSHPTEQGCKIMILRHLIDVGFIQPSEDNAHLDERNSEIAAEILAAWEARTGKPRVGDYVRMPNGALRRCSHAWDDGMQTSDGGSYSITKSGRASMSGSLYPSQLWEYFKDTGEMKAGRFWFFSHGIAGAGRGVDFYLPCRVYELAPFAMTEEQARAHPVAIRAAEFWGQDHREHLSAIAGLMNPAALRGGYC